MHKHESAHQSSAINQFKSIDKQMCSGKSETQPFPALLTIIMTGLLETIPGPEVGFEEIAIDLPQARF